MNPFLSKFDKMMKPLEWLRYKMAPTQFVSYRNTPSRDSSLAVVEHSSDWYRVGSPAPARIVPTAALQWHGGPRSGVTKIKRGTAPAWYVVTERGDDKSCTEASIVQAMAIQNKTNPLHESTCLCTICQEDARLDHGDVIAKALTNEPETGA